MSDSIKVSLADKVQTIRFNRPEKKNAITSAMYAELASALEEAYEDQRVRAILFLGSPGIFSAGNDIADFLKVATSGDRASLAVFDFLEQIIMAEKPLVAGVDGMAIGVGATMLLHCDYVLASSESRFRTPFVDLGLVPEAGSSLLAPRLMGHGRAFALLAMGEEMRADAAYSAGLVHHIVDAEEIEKAAVAAAARIAEKPPEALAISRHLIRGDRSDVLARMREEAEYFEERLKSDEARAAFMAFMARK